MTEQKIAPVLTGDEVSAIIDKVFENNVPAGYGARIREACYFVEQTVLARVGAVREQALEEAAACVDAVCIQKWRGTSFYSTAAQQSADAIRALKGTPAAAVADAQPVVWLTSDRKMLIFADKISAGRARHSGMTPLYEHTQPSSNPGPLAAVERDAERYRWIRNRLSVRLGVVTEGMEKRGAWLLQLSPIEVDMTALMTGPADAVDAAIAASKEGASQ